MRKGYKFILLLLSFTSFNRAGAQTELTYYTSLGSFKVMLTDTLTPITVDSFKSRVAHKFYDGLIFHRVIDGFVIQGGDPNGNGTGGPGYATPDEFNANLKNVAGSLAMANSGPNTNGSQFYFNLVNNASLNNHYTVFGMVTTGFTVVQNIGHVATNSNDKPLTNVYIDSIRITHIPTSIHSVAGSIAAAVYPNPCRGMFTIDLPGIATKVELISTEGRLIYSATAKGRLNIDLRSRPAGLYLLHIANENGSGESKVIVQ